MKWTSRISYDHLTFHPFYSKYPLISQQLLTIQEELNNKKSELEQAKEEQSHTQALLKVLQEQVRECMGSGLTGSHTDAAPRGWASLKLKHSPISLFPAHPSRFAAWSFSQPPHLSPLSGTCLDFPSPPAVWESFFQKTNEFWWSFKTLAVQIYFTASN